MAENDIIIIPFIGVQRRQKSTASFDEVLARLLAEVGSKPISMEAVSALGKTKDHAAFETRINALLGPRGFLLFGVVDLAGWMRPVDARGRIMRLDIGNPLIVRSMMQSDPWAGLFGPVSLLLVENQDARTCSLTYVVPSTLIVVDFNADVAALAKELDIMINALATSVANAA